MKKTKRSETTIPKIKEQFRSNFTLTKDNYKLFFQRFKALFKRTGAVYQQSRYIGKRKFVSMFVENNMVDVINLPILFTIRGYHIIDKADDYKCYIQEANLLIRDKSGDLVLELPIGTKLYIDSNKILFKTYHDGTKYTTDKNGKFKVLKYKDYRTSMIYSANYKKAEREIDFQERMERDYMDDFYFDDDFDEDFMGDPVGLVN